MESQTAIDSMAKKDEGRAQAYQECADLCRAQATVFRGMDEDPIALIKASLLEELAFDMERRSKNIIAASRKWKGILGQ